MPFPCMTFGERTVLMQLDKHTTLKPSGPQLGNCSQIGVKLSLLGATAKWAQEALNLAPGRPDVAAMSDRNSALGRC